jgi:glycosyltransferase involved in cell wall biosynthesis
MKKLAIITSHPIQYNAPLFKTIASRKIIQLKVFYTWGEEVLENKYDPGFKKNVDWDIPLLDGYEYEFLENTSTKKGSHHFNGIVNPAIIERVEAYDPDAVLVFGWAFSGHLKAIRYFKNKIPVYFRGDSTLLDRTNKYKAIARSILLKWIYKHIDYALFVGQNNKKYFLQYGLKEEQLIFAPHAIDNDRFSNPDDIYTNEANEWKRLLDISENDIVLIFSGKLEAKKNPLFLIELLKHCRSNYLKVIIVGDGALEKEIRKYAIEDNRLCLISFQNQQKMPVVYRLADIFILPSIGPGETWGLAANEAMASGCVIMLSEKVGGAIDLVKERENGIVFKLGDVKKCVDFIEELFVDRNKLTEMKVASKDLVNNFSFTHIATAIERLVLQS